LLQKDPPRLPTFHFDADPDPAFYFDADPNPASRFNADPDPAFRFDADSVRIKLPEIADPDPQH
jgi:hypothetical protein